MNISEVRKDFPTIRNGRGVYLDSACQSLRPDSVIEAMTRYYTDFPACGGRSVHSMSNTVALATDETRETLASFFGTDDPDCYIFTKNCTEGLNTVAHGFGLKKGDAVVTSDTEHNSNHVPWLSLESGTGIKRRFSVSDGYGEFDLESFKSVMGKDVKLVSVQHASNVTGCITPLKDIIDIAHGFGAKVLVDGAQSAPHMKIDLKRLDADFFSMSIHKMLGPSGMGVLYGKRECLEKLLPLSSGGGTVGLATYNSVDFAPIPDRFEPGLQNYSGIIGTKAALDYINKIGLGEIEAHERAIMRQIFKETAGVKGLEVIGPSNPDRRCGIFSFNVEGMLSHDVAMILDSADNIMIRSGMHCSHPYFVSRHINGSARASTYLYNDGGDIKRFAAALVKIAETFSSH